MTSMRKGKFCTLKPCACSSAMAAVSWGTEAEMFGNLMMHPSGVFASSPNHARSSDCLCSY